MSEKIGFIGAGNMAGAIVEGILKKGVSKPQDLLVFDKDPRQAARFEKRGVGTAPSIRGIADASAVLFLSVKPQNYEEVLLPLKGAVGAGTVLVSIAAGISTGYIKSRVGQSCKVVRAMPNTPLLLGAGATALCGPEPVTEGDFAKVKRIFEAGGAVEVLPEEKMNAVIAVNGSSPAYVYLFAKAVIDGAVRQGIDAAAAKRLIAKTLEGSAKMLTDSGHEPDELIRMVSSPGGTTLKALEALYAHHFEQAISDAMEACTRRAEELGK